MLSRDSQCRFTVGSSSARFDSSRTDACPSTKLCSRLHCKLKNERRSCSVLWTGPAMDGSPCGTDGKLDSSRVCVSGFCVPAKIASNSSFTCSVEGGKRSEHCVADDLSQAGSRSAWRWDLFAAIPVIIIMCMWLLHCLFKRCCCRGRPVPVVPSSRRRNADVYNEA